MNKDTTTPKPADSEQPSPKGLDGAACSPVRFNVNCYVRVRITPYGEECLLKNYQEFVKDNPKLRAAYQFQLPKTDDDGWTRFQLHNLMASFGPYLHCGCRIPFETEIEILLENAKRIRATD